MARETIKGDFYPSDEPETGYWRPEHARTLFIYRMLWVVGVVRGLFSFVGNFVVMVGTSPFRRMQALDSITGHVAMMVVCIGVAEGLKLIATRPRNEIAE